MGRVGGGGGGVGAPCHTSPDCPDPPPQFFTDVREAEELLRKTRDTMERKYSCDRGITVTRLEDLLQDCTVSGTPPETRQDPQPRHQDPQPPQHHRHDPQPMAAPSGVIPGPTEPPHGIPNLPRHPWGPPL